MQASSSSKPQHQFAHKQRTASKRSSVATSSQRSGQSSIHNELSKQSSSHQYEEENKKDQLSSTPSASGTGSGSDNEEEDEVEIKGDELLFHSESNFRAWLRKHGKSKYIDFEDEELRKLRGCFDSLDDDGSHSIGVDELEDPLIALGLVENRQQVQRIVQMVDEDGSELIEFGEFLSIIKGGNKNTKDGKDSGTGAIFKFFKNLTSGNLKSKEKENMPFSLFISSERRKKILDSMMGETDNDKKQGETILNNYKKQLAEKMARERAQIVMPSAGESKLDAKSSLGGKKMSREEEFQFQRFKDYETNDVPDPEMLKAILNRKSRIPQDP